MHRITFVISILNNFVYYIGIGNRRYIFLSVYTKRFYIFFLLDTSNYISNNINNIYVKKFEEKNILIYKVKQN